MLKNLFYPLPTCGAIRLGHIAADASGRNLPVKDDFFSVTYNYKSNGGWVLHKMHEKLMQEQKLDVQKDKLRTIPIKVIFNDIDFVMREGYEAFDRKTGRTLCRGNGEKCRRIDPASGKIESYDCPSPTYCEFGQEARCKPFARANFQIDGQDDALSTFILRTTSYNSVRTLRAKLTMIKALCGGLAGVPLVLRLVARTATQSYNQPFYFTDVQLAKSIEESRKAHEEFCKNNSVDELETALRPLFENGSFEDTVEEADDIKEFMSDDAGAEIVVPKGIADESAPPPSSDLDDLSALVKQRAESALPQSQPVVILN